MSDLTARPPRSGKHCASDAVVTKAPADVLKCDYKASDLYNNSMAVDKQCDSQPSRQMQRCVTLSSERDVDSAFAEERRWRGEFDDEYATEIDQTTVGNGGHGNVES